MYGEDRGLSRRNGRPFAEDSTAGEGNPPGAKIKPRHAFLLTTTPRAPARSEVGSDSAVAPEICRSPNVENSNNTLKSRKQEAISRLARCPRLMVALSGGVDSAVLLSLAVEALGPDRVVAVTGRSPSLAAEDLVDAGRIASALAVRHEVVDTHEMDRSEYRANSGDRCFHCWTELFEVLERLASEWGFPAVAYGAIADDDAELRPGMRAAEERGILAPLLEAGIGKAGVRTLAAEAGLAVREKPAAACLASRIPVGTEVTVERLGRIERAERGLRGLGFRQFRVRDHGQVARLELDADGQRRITESHYKEEAIRVVQEAGFRFVTVDLEGYRAGSLDVLPGRARDRTGPTLEGGQ